MGGCVLLLSHNSLADMAGITLASLDEKGLQVIAIHNQ
jgi:hypothetical protein